MYNVTKGEDSKYGNVIIITTEDIGEFELPFAAIQKARTIKRQWITNKKIRFLINNQVYSINQIDSWADNEYKGLIKCGICCTILNDKDVFINPHCGIKLFCSQLCADKDYKYYLETLDEEEECDYL